MVQISTISNTDYTTGIDYTTGRYFYKWDSPHRHEMNENTLNLDYTYDLHNETTVIIENNVLKLKINEKWVPFSDVMKKLSKLEMMENILKILVEKTYMNSDLKIKLLSKLDNEEEEKEEENQYIDPDLFKV
jgi:hypothetical protein